MGRDGIVDEQTLDRLLDEVMRARAYDLAYARVRDDARTLRWRGKGGERFRPS